MRAENYAPRLGKRGKRKESVVSTITKNFPNDAARRKINFDYILMDI